MPNAGDTVAVHYRGTKANGEVFDNSRERGEPYVFQIGDGRVLDGFDEAVRGLEVGQSVTVTLPPEQAYGDHDEHSVFVFPRSDVPPDIEVGRSFRLPIGPRVRVTKMEGDEVTVDANHPLAGETVTFEIELVEVH